MSSWRGVLLRDARSGARARSSWSLYYQETAARALWRAVWIGIIALFDFGLHDAVAAVLANRAVCIATVVPARILVFAVVTLFAGCNDPVAADGRAFAAR